MKKALLIIIIAFISCTEDCEVNSDKLAELSVLAEAKRKEILAANTTALKNALQLQLDDLKQQINDVASECD